MAECRLRVLAERLPSYHDLGASLMRKYRTLATVCLFDGVIGLSDEQADVRRHCLKKIGKGKFKILQPVQFKAGEIIGFDTIPKPMGQIIQRVNPSTPDTT